MLPFLLLLLHLQGTEVKSEEKLSQLENFLGANSEEPPPSVVYQLFGVSGFLHSPPDPVWHCPPCCLMACYCYYCYFHEDYPASSF